MSIQSARPLSLGRAVSCALVNQLATPGLGSLTGRRFFAGSCQLLIALAGFVLLVGWMAESLIVPYYQQAVQDLDKPPPPGPVGWMGRWGLILFGISWLWSLVTSLSMIRQAKSAERNAQNSVPPIIPPPGPDTPA